MLVGSRIGRCGAFGAALWLCCSVATAEDDAATRQAARKLAEDGVAALQAGDASTASQKLEKAYQMLQVPSVALWSARALQKRGAWVEAAERLRETARLPSSGDAAVQDQAKRDAEAELASLTPRIPNLVIHVAGAEPARVTVTLDGVAVPRALWGEDRPVNPGSHHLVGQAGTQETTLDVAVAEAERKEAKLTFQATSAPLAVAEAPPPPSGSSKTLAYVTLGAGALGLIVGGVSGGMAIGKRNALDDSPHCQAGICTHAVDDDVKSLRTFRTVSTVGFVAGGVLVAAGTVLWLTTGSPSKATGSAGSSLAIGVGAGELRVAGGF
jgi:hypothetical protein